MDSIAQEIGTRLLAEAKFYGVPVDVNPSWIGESFGKTDFSDWLPIVTPAYSWHWEHLVFIREQIAKVTNGACQRLILSVPPRHGKSEMVTVRYSAWVIETQPEKRVIIGAYNQTLANKFSRKVRRIVESRMVLSKERNAVEDWETLQGGGCRAVGVGGGITGQGGDLIIIDDPVKNREEANSETYREKVWDWFRDDLYTRCEPNASIILIMTRWHDDDLAGRILGSDDKENWTLINLPALAEEDDPLGRDIGQALCPERYNEAELKSIHTVLGNSFYALYQGRPLPLEGGMFKRHWFEGKIMKAPPADTVWCRHWDLAATKDLNAARTAGVKIGRTPEGKFVVGNVVKVQEEGDSVRRLIKGTAELDGVDVLISLPQDPGQAGKVQARDLIAMLWGYNARAEPETGDKATRAEPFAAQCEAGNVYLVQGDWNQSYIDELCAFPQNKFKDQVDASSGAFARLFTDGFSPMDEDSDLGKALLDR
jgi:predicted phage terminase large subunit-like protein